MKHFFASIIFVCSLQAELPQQPLLFRSMGQPSWDDRLNMAAIEKRLANEEIANTQKINTFLKKQGKSARGDSSILFVMLESGLKAVFKPGEYQYAEVAAYRASKKLGLRLVPPTVFRTINGVQGSLQFLVQSSLDLKKIPNFHEIFRKVSAKDINDMHIFYYVFGQWDTHRGNQIISLHNNKAYLALIDNAGILHRSYTKYGDYSFIEKGDSPVETSVCTTAFPYDQVKTIRPKSYKELKKAFSPYITDEAIHNIFERKTPINYCIWCNVLWVQMYTRSAHIKPSVAKEYYASTLKAYEKLDAAMLEEIWHEWLLVDRAHGEHLIALTLDRRDQLLRAAYASTMIVDDLVKYEQSNQVRSFQDTVSVSATRMRPRN